LNLASYVGGLGTIFAAYFGYKGTTSLKTVFVDIKKVASSVDKIIDTADNLDSIKTLLEESVGNITLTEFSEIVKTANLYSSNGYTPEELKALGKRIVDAAASK